MATPMRPAQVRLYGEIVGQLTPVGGDRTIFSFDDAWVEKARRPTLSLSFAAKSGGLLLDQRPTQTRLSPFFSNLLPEGPLRELLAARAGVLPVRELPLLQALGGDLPGAVEIVAMDWRADSGEHADANRHPSPEIGPTDEQVLRFSLAGVQLKFSAIEAASGGLTIPADGMGGSWILKLPSTRFPDVARNEFAMMTLARMVGLDMPDVRLIDLNAVSGLPNGVARLNEPALAVRRFDRLSDGGRLHMEDFAQVFGVYPEAKYAKASYRNIAAVLVRETGLEGVREFIARLVFNALIGNADMHLKNWALLHPPSGPSRLAPGYDFVSTQVYLPDPNAALTYTTTKAHAGLTLGEIEKLLERAGGPKGLARDVVGKLMARFDVAVAELIRTDVIGPSIAAVIAEQRRIVPVANEV